MRLVISFDPAKDVLNQEKHGTSLSEAEHLVWEEALISEDRRKAYGEKRMIAIAHPEHRERLAREVHEQGVC
jgi:uncharacterized DUF497 family protein